MVFVPIVTMELECSALSPMRDETMGLAPFQITHLSRCRHMKLFFTAFVSLLFACAASAQSAESPYKKVAITSLIGDVITVDVYRKRVGTMIDSNQQEKLPVSTPVFDEAAMKAASDAVNKALPSTSVATLAVAEAGSDLDPAQFLIDGRIAASHRLVVALRDGGFTHLLVIAKHRAPARLKLVDASVGSGHLQGLGFYVDNVYKTRRSDTLETGTGFVAPYVYIKLSLVDLTSMQQTREQVITEGIVRSAARNKEGFDAWGALTPEEKVSWLQRIIRTNVSEATPLLFNGQ